MTDQYNGLTQIAALFGKCTTPVEELIKPATDPIVKPEPKYYEVPDLATMDLGYSETWHDLIDIRVPLGRVPMALLMPRVPLPLHHRNPRRILSEIDRGWWDRTRKRVYEVQNQHCAVCGCHKYYQKSARKVMEAHELYEIDYKQGTMRLLGIIPICSVCHKAIHFGMSTAWYESGKLDSMSYFGIINNANAVLANAGLPQKNWDANVNDNKYDIPWDKWKLILTIDGQDYEYHSLYKDQAELEANY